MIVESFRSRSFRFTARTFWTASNTSSDTQGRLHRSAVLDVSGLVNQARRYLHYEAVQSWQGGGAFGRWWAPIHLCCCKLQTGFNSVTVTLTGLAASVLLAVSEYSGIDTSTPVDVSTWGFQYGTGASSETLSVTTTGTNRLLVSAVEVRSYTGTSTPAYLAPGTTIGAVWSGLIQNPRIQMA